MRHGVIGAIVAVVLFGAGSLLGAEQGVAKSLVEADWLATRLGSSNLVVLDIRNRIDGGSREVFAKGHIPGAVYSDYLGDGWRSTRDGVPGMLPPIADLEKLIGGLGIGNDAHVVIVPGGVSAVDYGSATRVFWTFKVLGHDKVSILDGGYKGWTADAKRPVTSGPSNPRAVSFRADFQRHLLATREDVTAALKDKTSLVDNRPPEQYSGQKKHAKAARAGTIPGAVNIPQDKFFDAASGRFAGRSDVATLWNGQSVAEDAEQIAFCNTGHWASLGWFASYALLGNSKARMYDGSMTQWTADPNAPVQ